MRRCPNKRKSADSIVEKQKGTKQQKLLDGTVETETPAVVEVNILYLVLWYTYLLLDFNIINKCFINLIYVWLFHKNPHSVIDNGERQVIDIQYMDGRCVDLEIQNSLKEVKKLTYLITNLNEWMCAIQNLSPLQNKGDSNIYIENTDTFLMNFFLIIGSVLVFTEFM